MCVVWGTSKILAGIYIDQLNRRLGGHSADLDIVEK
jgi:hypothetical protein